MKILWLPWILLVLLGAIVPSSSARTNELLVDEAVADLQGKGIDAALKKLLEAEKSAPGSAVVLNLLGAAYTKKKDYVTARSYFEKSLARQPSFFPPAFNLGELLFLEGQYPRALEAFSKLLAADPDNELLQFKVVLCLMLADQDNDAKKLLQRMRFPGQGPAWYYAQAAFQMNEGHRRQARELLACAQVIFPKETSLYDETFENLGWPTR